MNTDLNQQMTKPYLRQVVRILALGALIICAGLTPTAPTFAQGSCEELNALTTFNYRSWGIGVHRDCGLDPVCHALRLKQIALGAPVAAWILASREAALSAGVSPMPPEIRNQLIPLFPPALLDRVRYKTGSGFLGTLQWFRSEMEGKGAITLVDVIVFVDPQRVNSLTLWAHELEHVRQYEQLTVDGFAQAYVDQTCILPGDNLGVGYDSNACQLERMADRFRPYADRRGFVECCMLQKLPATLVLRDRVLNDWEEFIARDSITIGPNVVLRPSGRVALRAGRIITMSPEFRSEPGGRLSATIEPTLNRACVW
jgi:Domain of unknown function (DUF4157)